MCGWLNGYMPHYIVQVENLFSTYYLLSLIFYSILAWYPPSLCSFLSPSLILPTFHPLPPPPPPVSSSSSFPPALLIRIVPEGDEDSQGEQQSSKGERVAHGIHDPQLTEDTTVVLLQIRQERQSQLPPCTVFTHTPALTHTVD